MQLRYPSPVLPGPPALRLEMPDGWEVLADPALDVAIRRRGGEGYAPNVAVVLTRFPLGHSFTAAAAALDAAVDELPDREDLGQRDVDQHGLPAHVREFVRVDASAGTLVQNVRVILLERELDTVVVQVTATVGGAEAQDLLQQLRDLADAVVVAPQAD